MELLFLLTELLDINKKRLENMNQSVSQSDNEYQQAYYEGIVSEIENSIWDLEEMIDKIRKG